MKTIELIAYMKNLGFTNRQSIDFIENELQKEKVNTKPFHLEELEENIYNNIKDDILKLFENINFIKRLNNNIYDEEVLDIIELSQSVNKFESIGASGRYLNCTWFNVGLIDGTSINVYWDRG